jgi:hypothetical protein
MEKIKKSEAKKMYDEGKEIYLNPSKMKFKSIWHEALKVSKSIMQKCYDKEVNFQQLTDSYHYYNCNKETGMIIHYYKD